MLHIQCQLCGSAKFRCSHLWHRDFRRILDFQYPVRCRKCGTRDYTNVFKALAIGRADHIRHAKRHLNAARFKIAPS